MTTNRIPEIVAGKLNDEASERIREYCTAMDPVTQRPVYTGSRFDDFAPTENPPNEFTAADLLSTGFLSVYVPGKAVMQILEYAGDELNAHLAQLSSHVDLHDLGDSGFDRYLGSASSPGVQLWDAIRGNRDKQRVGMGSTLTSKLMARKRPRLIPIWDSRIKKQSGLDGSRDHWSWMREILQANHGDLVKHLEEIRAKSGQSGLSLLRTFDIAVWHAESFQDWSAQSGDMHRESLDGPGHIGTVPGEDDAPYGVEAVSAL